MLNMIKQLTDENIKFSHILNIKVSNQTSSLVGTKIRQYFFKELYQVSNAVDLNGEPVVIKWYSSKKQNSAYYVSNSIYNDEVTAWHTGKVRRRIIGHLQRTFTILSYLAILST